MRTWILAPVLLLLLPACSAKYRSDGPSGGVSVAEATRQGPPPHAPAHGYRHKHGDGAELRYDKSLQVYVVIGRSEHYFDEGFYFRYSGDGWEMSASLDGRWTVASASRVPKSLHHKKGKK